MNNIIFIVNKLSLAELKPIQLSPVQLKFELDQVRLSWFSTIYIFLGTENCNHYIVHFAPGFGIQIAG